ncbi:tRNA (adenosine(37)-N6)-threonylcarbamoyltransferase complex ATPase subunit type 1 TsaE [Candidatus Saccharibacteria bacterium oral taxon 488]|nr:tRNA (adenosine(37)-N6)-threonylcarbamoyltransferase complex ATPase subunit type 1 TsaE [Candidatus Saccharibacteria bacterium oral taxon 488]
MTLVIASSLAMQRLGQIIGSRLRGGEVIELVGDIGAGKTTLTKGIAEGLDITEPVQSPTFTISRVYQSPRGLTLAHYDFYRLGEAGIMAEEIREVTMQPQTVTVVEWAGAVEQVLPADRLTARILAIDEQSRRVTLSAGGPTSQALLATISAADEELA